MKKIKKRIFETNFFWYAAVVSNQLNHSPRIAQSNETAKTRASKISIQIHHPNN